MEHDAGGWTWIIIDIAAVLALGLAVAWASRQSLAYRRSRRLPVDGHPASPEEVARGKALGQGPEKSSVSYLLQLGLSIAVALFLCVYLVVQLI